MKKIEISGATWRRIVADHERAWEEVADHGSGLGRGSWDVLVCILDGADGTTAILPAKQDAPFWVPQVPSDDGFRPHLVMFGSVAVIQIPELDLGRRESDPSDEEGDDALRLHVRALTESLSGPIAEAALARLGGVGAFTVAWSPPSESGWYVHLHHLRGAAFGEPVPTKTAYGALAPLFWHHHTDVGRYHSGLVFDGDVLVEATLEGPDVTDETLELLTPNAAACCSSLRVLKLRATRVRSAAIDRLQGLLPTTRIERS